MFVGLSPETVGERGSVEGFSDKYGITWPIGVDANGTLRSLGVEYLPNLFVVGVDGKIAWNSMQGGDLKSAIDAALAKAGSG